MAYVMDSFGTKKMKRIDPRFEHSSAHSASAGYCAGSLNAYLANSMSCGGELMDKSVFYPTQSSGTISLNLEG